MPRCQIRRAKQHTAGNAVELKKGQHSGQLPLGRNEQGFASKRLDRHVECAAIGELREANAAVRIGYKALRR
jgi:hypothetical protein